MACTCLLPLGRDRLYRRYWLLPTASTLFVEDDCFGLTEDMLHPCPKPAETTTTMEHEEVVKEEPAEGRLVLFCSCVVDGRSVGVQRFLMMIKICCTVLAQAPPPSTPVARQSNAPTNGPSTAPWRMWIS